MSLEALAAARRQICSGAIAAANPRVGGGTHDGDGPRVGPRGGGGPRIGGGPCSGNADPFSLSLSQVAVIGNVGYT